MKTLLGRLAVVAVACILALALNRAILSLFGQTSPDRAEHSLVGILLLLGVVVTSSHNWDKPGEAVGVVALALVPCYLGTVFPDWDLRLLGIGAHRNPLFHSSLSFLVLRLLVGSRMGLPGFWSRATASALPATCGGILSPLVTSVGCPVAHWTGYGWGSTASSA